LQSAPEDSSSAAPTALGTYRLAAGPPGLGSCLRYFSLDLPQFFGFAPTVAERTGFLLDSLGVVGIVS
jgi:hypothetical protein